MPAYGDVHAKVAIDLGGAGQLHLLDIFSMDASSSTREDALENGENSFGYLNTVQNTAGMAWKKIWGSDTYSSATLAHTYTMFDQGYASAHDSEQLMKNASNEQEWKLRAVNTFRLSGALTLEAGLDARLSRYNLDMLYGAGPDPLGNPVPQTVLSGVYSTLRGGAFLQGQWRLLQELFVAPSARIDYDDFTRRTEISPRLSIVWEALSVATVTLSGGVYRQNLPAVLTKQSGADRNLSSPTAWHTVAGLSYLLAPDTRILLEAYDKRYERLPMDPAQPSLCVLDELALTMDYFLGHGKLTDAGVARSTGVEFSLQKRMVKDLYGTVSASLSCSRYRGLDGVWRDRSYDNRYTFSVMGGYAPGRDWELSIRWIFAGGSPYTPFDEEASRAAQSGVFDSERINALRLPDYHTLNIRADKRFFFSRTTLTVFVAVWNLYGRKNVPYYRWNEITGKTEAPNLWSNNPLPVFGVEYEF